MRSHLAAVIVVMVAAACALAGCTGTDSSASAAAQRSSAAAQKARSAAQQKALCQQYCGTMAALAASAEKQCPDPGTFTTAGCRTWESRALSLAGSIRGLTGTSGGQLELAKEDLTGFQSSQCNAKTTGAGADILQSCQSDLVRGIIALGLTREDMAGSRTPGPIPMTRADHRWALGVVLTPVSSALARARHAGTIADIKAGLIATDAAAQAAGNALGAEVPALPADKTAESALGLALAGLSNDLETGTTTSSCGAPAPSADLVALGTGTAYRQDLPRAIHQMAVAGYAVPLVLPAMPAQLNRRLSNGKLIKDTATGGLGELTVDGSFDSDSVVELVTGGHAVLEVYVRDSGSPSVDGIPDGTYDVYLATGQDWDSARKSFTRSCDYQKFDSPLDYETTDVTSTTYTISIDAVPGGNTTVSPVSGLPQ